MATNRENEENEGLQRVDNQRRIWALLTHGECRPGWRIQICMQASGATCPGSLLDQDDLNHVCPAHLYNRHDCCPV